VPKKLAKSFVKHGTCQSKAWQRRKGSAIGLLTPNGPDKNKVATETTLLPNALNAR